LILSSGVCLADSYVGGIPLTPVHNGTVDGGVYFDSYYGTGDQQSKGSKTIEKTFTIPANADVEWAMLLTTVYCGHMQNNYQGTANVNFNGQTLGTETLNVPFTYLINGGEGYVWVNDHTNRVTSDYMMYYDVTNLVKSGENKAVVKTDPLDSSFDGRVKMITLVVAYNDGSGKNIWYQVNRGHDPDTYYGDDELGENYIGSTAFEAALPDGSSLTDSKLTILHLASTDGTYIFNGKALTSGTPQGTYTGSNTWNVKDSLISSGINTLTYDRTAAFYKNALGILTAEYTESQESAPVANFTASSTSGNVPLTVQFTDTSTGSVSSYAWDFDNDGTVDSTDQNPVHTYTSAGTYTVNLTVSNKNGTDSKSTTINVSQASAAYVVSFNPQTVEMQPGSSQDVQIVMDKVPAGLAGFDITISVSDPEIAEITAVSFPSWGQLPMNYSVPSSSVWIKTVDLENKVVSGDTNVLLGTVTLSGKKEGTTELYIPKTKISADGGSPIDPNVIKGSIKVLDKESPVINNVKLSNNAPETGDSIVVTVDATDNVGVTSVKANEISLLNQGGNLWNGSITALEGTHSVKVSAVDGAGNVAWDNSTSYTAVTPDNLPPSSITNLQSTKGTTWIKWTWLNPTDIDFKHTEVYLNGAYQAATSAEYFNATGLAPETSYTIGTRTVDLTGNVNDTWVNQTVTTEKEPIPVAKFTTNVSEGYVPLTVQFNDNSENAVSFNWDFGDGATSTEKDPIHTYVTAGIYTVKLTATNAAGSNSTEKAGYITVNAGATNDLTISGAVNPVPASAVFAKEPNTVRINNIKNTGPSSLTNITVALYASDVSDGTVPVNTTKIASLESGETTSITLLDPTIRNLEGGTVTYTAVVDPENLIAETNEANNNKSSPVKPVKYNGYKGKRYWEGGSDITTKQTYDLQGNLVYFTQPSSAYKSVGWIGRTETWTESNLPIPASATVENVWLYVPYNWDTTSGGVPKWTIAFNEKALTNGTLYTDKSNFGGYADYTYGLYVYDVTSQFKSTGNSLTLTPEAGNSNALYPSTLVVIYKDPSESRKQIFINEECDELGYSVNSYGTTLEEATAYAPFTGMEINVSAVKNATLYSFAGSAGPDEGNLFFNGKTVATNAWQGDPSTSSAQIFDVKNYLNETGNEAGIQGTESGGMDALQQILVIEYARTAPDAPVADFSAIPTSGTAPLTVTFEDNSTGFPTSWFWDFGDGTKATEQNVSHTYTSAGNYTVNLTVSNAGGSDSEVKTEYIVVSEPLPAAPVANFTATPTSGVAPLTVNFMDQSTGDGITAWAWDFDNDGTIDSTDQNPSHTYTSAGTYTVNLKVSNENGTDSKTATINVSQSVLMPTFPGCTNPPADLDQDGLYEDINGNGELDFDDVVAYYENMDWLEENMQLEFFDYNNNGLIDFDDVVKLYNRL